MNPTQGDVHVSSALTNISVAYMQDDTDFIATKVFPLVPVMKQTDKYFVFDKNDFMRDEMRVKAAGHGGPAKGGFRLSTDSYDCTVKAYGTDIFDQVRANADSVLNLDRAATNFVTTKALLNIEREFVTSYFTTSKWGTDATPSVLWSAANSDPQGDVDTGKKTVKTNTGKMPNTLVLGLETYLGLRKNAQIKDQFKYTSDKSITPDILARFFDVDRVLVGGASYATNREGATGAYSLIWGKHALLCYTPSAPSIEAPAAGYIFAWQGFVGSSNGIRIKKYRAPEAEEADTIEAQRAHSMKLVGSDLGYFFNGAVA